MWMADEHLGTSGVGAGSPSTMMVKDLPEELETVVARVKQHVRWVVRHQPACSCLAVYYGGGDKVFRMLNDGKSLGR